nr:hypothetical protein [Pandoravirus massiliensis]
MRPFAPTRLAARRDLLPFFLPSYCLYLFFSILFWEQGKRTKKQMATHQPLLFSIHAAITTLLWTCFGRTWARLGQMHPEHFFFSFMAAFPLFVSWLCEVHGALRATLSARALDTLFFSGKKEQAHGFAAAGRLFNRTAERRANNKEQ